MFSSIEPNRSSGGGRLLARQLARELTKDELRLIAGGRPSAGGPPVVVSPGYNSSSDLTCTQSPCPTQGDTDGGGDD
jgi:hypothetical protein